MSIAIFWEVQWGAPSTVTLVYILVHICKLFNMLVVFKALYLQISPNSNLFQFFINPLGFSSSVVPGYPTAACWLPGRCESWGLLWFVGPWTWHRTDESNYWSTSTSGRSGHFKRLGCEDLRIWDAGLNIDSCSERKEVMKCNSKDLQTLSSELARWHQSYLTCVPHVANVSKSKHQ